MAKQKLKTVLTKVDCCYIENNRGLPPETLSQDLGATVASIQVYLDTLNTTPQPKRKSRKLDLMTSKEKVTMRKGIVVMTEAASENDSNVQTGGSNRFKQSITRIYDSD